LNASLVEAHVSEAVIQTMEQLQRILGIDFGTTRIGLSLSDPLLILAHPYSTLTNDHRALVQLDEIVVREKVGLIVVGMPFNLKGERGGKALEVERFIEKLKGAVHVEIVTWDERFTTVIAHQTLQTMGTRQRERRTNKGRVDAMAAALLLQSYLDSRKRSSSC
jgi:putative Holliday junction resolvase